MEEIDVNPENRWRLNSPGAEGWKWGLRPGAKKYFMISVDTHLSPPAKLFTERMDSKWHDQLPRIEQHADGNRYFIVPGQKPERISMAKMEGEDLRRSKSGTDIVHLGEDTSMTLQRIADQALDGVDGEVIFPNGQAMLVWSYSDPEFMNAFARVWNDWAWEVCAPYKRTCNPAAAIITADIPSAIKEVERVAKLGYRVLVLPCKPIYGPETSGQLNYNLPDFDPLWAAIQDHDLAITYHIGTGKDPRTARGYGGAIINYAVHASGSAMEPIVGMCASGVFERHPKLRVATIEADAGWVPWTLQKMDEAYLKHHFWVRPKLKKLPSEYYRSNCHASFGEDPAALALVESFNLTENFMWANDYPHHEGSWPHSAEAIERTFPVTLGHETRAKLLGLNAARVFGFEVPEDFRI